MSDTYAGGGCCGDEGPYYFDEHGYLIEDAGHHTGRAGGGSPSHTTGTPVHPPVPSPPAEMVAVPVRPAEPVIARLTRPCGLSVLNGSWLLEFTERTQWPVPALLRRTIRGPMRVEVRDDALRISGDIYVWQLRDVLGERPVLTTTLDHPEEEHDVDLRHVEPMRSAEVRYPWLGTTGAPLVASYPQLPPNEYSWYFRSTGVSYVSGTLSFAIVRHLWDRTSREFVSQDTGQVRLTCRRSILTPFGTAAVMTGTVQLGRQVYDLKATKTSDRYRGCAVEVDVMTGRDWPASVVHQGLTRTFRSVFASSGWDVAVDVDELDVPEDADLTMAELQTLLSTHRGAGSANAWRLWLLVGSRQGSTFGIMFDDDSVPGRGRSGSPTRGWATIPSSRRRRAGRR